MEGLSGRTLRHYRGEDRITLQQMNDAEIWGAGIWCHPTKGLRHISERRSKVIADTADLLNSLRSHYSSLHASRYDHIRPMSPVVSHGIGAAQRRRNQMAKIAAKKAVNHRSTG